jgi:hypothetical protein
MFLSKANGLDSSRFPSLCPRAYSFITAEQSFLAGVGAFIQFTEIVGGPSYLGLTETAEGEFTCDVEAFYAVNIQIAASALAPALPVTITPGLTLISSNPLVADSNLGVQPNLILDNVGPLVLAPISGGLGMTPGDKLKISLSGDQAFTLVPEGTKIIISRVF